MLFHIPVRELSKMWKEFIATFTVTEKLIISKCKIQFGDPIKEHYKEDLGTKPAIRQLEHCFTGYREAAISIDPKFDHIDVAEKQVNLFS